MSIAVFDWMRSAWTEKIARSTAAGRELEEGLGQLVATTMWLSTPQVREMNRRIGEIITEYNHLKRDGGLAFAPGDPESPGRGACSSRPLGRRRRAEPRTCWPAPRR